MRLAAIAVIVAMLAGAAPATAATLFITNTSLRASETDDRIESSAKKSYVFKTYLQDDSIKTESKSGMVTLTGTVSAFSFRNPHCFLYLDVDAGPYKGRRYVVEMSSAGVLTGAGWDRSRLKTGDAVAITVLPARTGSAAGLCRACEIRVNGVVTKLS